MITAQHRHLDRVQAGWAAALWRLARCCGISPAFTSVSGKRLRASPDSVLRTLQAFGVPINTAQQAAGAIRDLRMARARRIVEPVTVVWSNRFRNRARIVLTLPERSAYVPIECRLVQDAGEQRQWRVKLSDVRAVAREEVCGEGFIRKMIDVPIESGSPYGYHRLEIAVAGEVRRCWIFVAPRTARRVAQRTWGVFIPTYAINSERNWGVGDLTDLGNLAQWTRELGGRVIGTLPMLASYLNSEPFEASPYAPVSRMFWNELFIDVEAAPEFALRPEAQELAQSQQYRREIETLREGDRIDYGRVMQRKREVLELLAQRFFASARVAALAEELQRSPELEMYARFRAATERFRAGWRSWPSDLRGAQELGSESFDESSRQYHLYVQLLFREQLAMLAQSRQQVGCELYLDLPVGTHPEGFDTWRHRNAFVEDAAAGAPPDAFFTHGQNWGFPPLHPEKMREDGHGYFRACVREHLRFAGGLRIDHVMWLHRLYWVPHGLAADEGVYVRYPAEELYAVLCIESHRAGAWIVGENLGTVPERVNSMMRRRAISPLYVAQFSWTGEAQHPLHLPEKHAVASLNTHDTPTFASFWFGRDIEQRVALGLLSETEAAEEREGRAHMRQSVIEFLRKHRVWLRDAGASDEDVVRIALALMRELVAQETDITIVNLEDLWAEKRPQNVPGTSSEENWRRRASQSVEQVRQSAFIRREMRRMSEVMQWAARDKA